MIRCPKCDHFNLADAADCERCGRPLAERVLQQAQAEAAESIDGQVLTIAGTAGKIAAIKYYREQTGAGLKDAKEAVEQLMSRHNVRAASTGCAGMLLLMAMSGLAFGVFAALAVLH